MSAMDRQSAAKLEASGVHHTSTLLDNIDASVQNNKQNDNEHKDDDDNNNKTNADDDNLADTNKNINIPTSKSTKISNNMDHDKTKDDNNGTNTGSGNVNMEEPTTSNSAYTPDYESISSYTISMFDRRENITLFSYHVADLIHIWEQIGDEDDNRARRILQHIVHCVNEVLQMQPDDRDIFTESTNDHCLKMMCHPNIFSDETFLDSIDSERILNSWNTYRPRYLLPSMLESQNTVMISHAIDAFEVLVGQSPEREDQILSFMTDTTIVIPNRGTPEYKMLISQLFDFVEEITFMIYNSSHDLIPYISVRTQCRSRSKSIVYLMICEYLGSKGIFYNKRTDKHFLKIIYNAVLSINKRGRTETEVIDYITLLFGATLRLIPLLRETLKKTPHALRDTLEARVILQDTKTLYGKYKHLHSNPTTSRPPIHHR